MHKSFSEFSTCDSESGQYAIHMNWLIGHFRRYLQRRPWDFCWRIGVESTGVSLAAAALLSLVLDTPRREFLDLPIELVFVVILVIAPPLETLLLQALPIFFVRLLKGSMGIQIFVSTLFFAALHFPEGVVTGISAGVIGGLYFAFAYAHWRTASRWQAFWITTACHFIHNAIAFVLLVVFGNWG